MRKFIAVGQFGSIPVRLSRYQGGEITYHLEKFGRILLELRKERGWTQSTLAKKMNLSAQSVSKWERGTSYPDIELFPVLAEIFDVDIGVLFGKNI